MARKTANRLADSAASVGYQNGWRDAHANLTPRMAEMEDRIEELEALLNDVMKHRASIIDPRYRMRAKDLFRVRAPTK